MIVSYTGIKPQITEIKYVDALHRTRISFDNGGEIVLYDMGATFVKKLPDGVIVSHVDQDVTVRDVTTAKDYAKLEPTPGAGAIVVGERLPGLKQYDLPEGTKYWDQVIPSIYGDLVQGKSDGRPVEPWQTIDKRVSIHVDAHNKQVLQIEMSSLQ